jgi:hypothetical protein
MPQGCQGLLDPAILESPESAALRCAGTPSGDDPLVLAAAPPPPDDLNAPAVPTATPPDAAEDAVSLAGVSQNRHVLTGIHWFQ